MVKGRGKTLLIKDVDLGDGKRCEVWLRLDGDGVTVRKKHSRSVWYVPLREAAAMISHRGQVRTCMMLMRGVQP